MFHWEQETGSRLVEKEKKEKETRHFDVPVSSSRRFEKFEGAGAWPTARRQKFKLPKVKGNPDREEANEGGVACTKGKRMRPEMSQDTWPASLRAASLFVLARSSNPGHDWRQRPKYIYDARNWRLDPYIGCFQKHFPLKLFVLQLFEIYLRLGNNFVKSFFLNYFTCFSFISETICYFYSLRFKDSKDNQFLKQSVHFIFNLLSLIIFSDCY